jgi:prolipoprotein diacylglyceryltransferase
MIFSILLALSSVLALIWVSLETPDSNMNARISTGIWALAGALIGSRTAYVGVHWEYFQRHLAEILQLWLGGLCWPGALAGGLLAVVLAAWLMGIPLRHLIDDLLPLLTSLVMVIWLGCWLTGCGYGQEASIGLPAQDEWGIWRRRIPVQLLAAISTVILFWGIESFRHHGRGLIPGLATSLGLGGLSLILLGASFLRVDAYPLYNGIRLETWAALIFLGISICGGMLAIVLNRD